MWYFYYLPLKSRLYGFGTIKREGVFVGVVGILGYGVLFSLPQVLLCTIRFKVSIMRRGKKEEWSHSAKDIGKSSKPRSF